ncbi:hypothetical protein ACVXHB_02600 [Escherichia coli]
MTVRKTQVSFEYLYDLPYSGVSWVSAAQIRQLAGMRGLMAKPDGSLIERQFGEASVKVYVLQYFISHPWCS